MAKLLMLTGLPASGKSTRAAEIVAQGNWVRLNKDLLRTMLHFDKFTGRNEGITKDSERAMAYSLLRSGYNVVIDDTNLGEGYKMSWSQIASLAGATFEVEKIDTPWVICVARDTYRREKMVGKHVIMDMAFANGYYDSQEKGLVLCDLDGTLCDIKHRLKFVKNLKEGQKPDWKSFFSAIPKDKVRKQVYKKLVKYYNKGHNIVLISARPETCREETEKWLKKNFATFPVALFMRRVDDHRPDTEIKQSMYDRLFKGKYPIEIIIDDRPSVIRMWKSNGLKVDDVGSGKEF